MDERLRQFVRERAGNRCEYCRLSQEAEPFFVYHIEHIVARQHGGGDNSENLALACYHCNAYKGPNLSAIDPQSGGVVELFHPRRHNWNEHFEQNGVLIIGRSAVGRATVSLLKMNAADRRRLREL
jgi:HNH endonuclease